MAETPAAESAASPDLSALSSEAMIAALTERGDLVQNAPEPLRLTLPPGGIVFHSPVTGIPVIEIGCSEAGGFLSIRDAGGALVATVQATAPGVGHLGAVVGGVLAAQISASDQGGVVTVFDGQGRPNATLQPGPTGGLAVVYHHDTEMRETLTGSLPSADPVLEAAFAPPPGKPMLN